MIPTNLSGFILAQQFYCPSQRVEFFCRDVLLVKWQGSAFTGRCPNESDTITIMPTQLSQSDVGNTTTCGIFTANITSLTETPIVNIFAVVVSLSFTATPTLNGTTVQCEDLDSGNQLEVDELLIVPGMKMLI